MTVPGATLGVDRQIDEHYTQIPNAALRGQIIDTRYAGVYGYILSHTEGWKLTEQRIAKDLGVGRKFIRNAIDNLAEAGCIRRTQIHNGNGFEGSLWYVTDLPFILMAADITDPDEVAAKVDAKFRTWLNARGYELADNGTARQIPRSELMAPECTTPEVHAPKVHNTPGTPKKNKGKNTNEEEDQDLHLAADEQSPSRLGVGPDQASDADASEAEKSKTDLNEGRDDVDRLCKQLRDRIVGNGCREPKITKAWRDQMRLLIDADGISEERVAKAIDWCQSDSFWHANILSPKKLREQYDKLQLRAAAEAKERQGGSNVHPLRRGRHVPYQNPPEDAYG